MRTPTRHGQLEGARFAQAAPRPPMRIMWIMPIRSMSGGCVRPAIDENINPSPAPRPESREHAEIQSISCDRRDDQREVR